MVYPKRSRGARPVRRGVVFLDRDGVLSQERNGYVLQPAQFRWIAGARRGLALFASAGIPVVVVTNQSAVGRELARRREIDAVHKKFWREANSAGARLLGIYFCPHAPWHGCACRKPRTGLLEAAQRDWGIDLARSYVVGDSASDLSLARQAGCRAILVLTGKGRATRRSPEAQDPRPDYIARDLSAAARWILRQENRAAPWSYP